MDEKTPLGSPAKQPFVLVIHGGAGTMSKSKSTPEQQIRYRTALSHALSAGYAVLSSGGDAINAAVSAVTFLEGVNHPFCQLGIPLNFLSKTDCPLFNSGKGAVFNVDGKNELEASIMLSKPPSTHPTIPVSRRGVGLSLLTRTRNPSYLARTLYLSPTIDRHVFLSGTTAERLGESLGVPTVDPSYFFTPHRWKEHRRGLGLPEEPFPPGGDPDNPPEPVIEVEHPTGTVGAVALDIHGCITVVTSTGGLTNKLVGRIGDTPSMGAGFWAEEWEESGRLRRAVGVSGTGDGDFFIRLSTAATIANLMRFKGESLQSATEFAVEELRRNGGMGGVIAVDQAGNGMYRGVIREDGIAKTALFADDVLE